MVDILQRDVNTIWGTKIPMHHRSGTNDSMVIESVMEYDEYKARDIAYGDNDIFIDIGAHIGTWSILMGIKNPTFKVYSFEAIPDNFELMKKNIILNNLTNVFPFLLAISDISDITINIYHTTSETPFGASHRFIGSMMATQGEHYETTTISLNDIFERNKIEKVRVIKTDCYDSETEILTKDGWKFFNFVSYSDEVATLNPQTNELEWQHPINIIWFPYKGKMYNVSTTQVNFQVTPNHKMYITHSRNGDFNLESANDIYGQKNLYKKDAIWHGKNKDYFVLPPVKMREDGDSYTPPIEIPMHEWVKFFGLWIAEGHTNITRKKNYSYISGVRNDDSELIQEIKSLLNKWGFYTSIYDTQLLISNKQLWHYLKQFGKSHDKFIPNEIKDLNSEHLSSLLDYYLKGDGVTGKFTGYTSSIKLRDDLQEIALKLNLSANYYLKNKRGHTSIIKNKEVITKFDVWTISFIKTSNTHETNKLTERWVEYNGYVGCVTVPNYHIIYTRREGKPIWLGNCEGCELKGFPTLPPERIRKIDYIIGEYHPFGMGMEDFFGLFKPNFVSLLNHHGNELQNFIFKNKEIN